MSRYFIDHPVFAWVISIVIMLAGALSITTLPVEQYPQIAPPTVTISASYPGASAETLENSVTQVIEQRLTGIDFLRYFSSTSDGTGNVQVTLTFEPEADPDIAQVQVQNKLQSALPLLPQEVQQQGVVVNKSTSGFLMVAAFFSKSGDTDQYKISDLLNSRMVDPLSRVPGVGSLTVFGQPYAMRVWLDPNKMYSFNLTTADVTAAIRAQNVDVSAGQLGGNPAVEGQQLNATIMAQAKLRTAEEFGDILLRVNTDGSQVRLKDVARLELGVQSYDIVARFNGKPAAGMGVSLATGANALETADNVKAKIAELKDFLPEDVDIFYPYDTTPFVRLSIESVIHTLIEAVVLVFLVMYLFLQSFRATLIPTIAVPIVLLGTFGVLAAFGFTINTLTMFAMVLAIGLLVDDAIVVVENVERVMEEDGLSPREATRKSMGQITGALVGIALVLSAVFVPMAFFSGSTGAIYRQFSLTIVSSMALSVLVALVLTPALCATILKPHKHGHSLARKGFFGWFNRVFDRSKRGYRGTSAYMARRPVRSLLLYALVIGGLVALFMRVPTSFLPDEDQGLMFVQVTTPPGATTERTLESVKQMEKYFLEDEKESVTSVFSVVGFNFAGRGQNSAMGFVRLKDWSERTRDDQTVFALSEKAMANLSKIKDAMVFSFFPPAIRELGNVAGFNLQLVDQAGLGHEALMAARNQFMGTASQSPLLVGTRPNGLDDVPQYKVDVDREKASALGISIADINATLQTAWGSSYINDFLHDGRIKRVYMQGDAPFRMLPEDVNKWYVRNGSGQMVPFSTIASAHWTFGSPKLERYNGISSRNMNGSPAPGVSSGAAMAEVERIAKTLPAGIGYEWTGLSYEELQAGAQTGMLYAISLLVVFLCLAALYESWSVPFSVMMVVPLGIVGAVGATYAAGLTNDVYFQVALLTTVGLTAKNAILIVEFAKELYEDQGKDLFEAAMTAAEMRLRPIIMTSMAFILGVTPLAVSSGAGSASRNAIGIAVIGGMASATFIAIFFVPMFFVLIKRIFAKKSSDTADVTTDENAESSPHA
ncbi:MAG TPA: efflux RND transporter permease subunit [Alphaproteobacteria bacterium]|nr:efflux RND transporter permease subunit [Alphaproteobacteria bacterium]